MPEDLPGEDQLGHKGGIEAGTVSRYPRAFAFRRTG